MNSFEAMFPPVFRLEGLERLEILDWDDIDASIQSILLNLDQEIRRICPRVRVTSGRNAAAAWELFSYRVYHSPDHLEVNPVVVGIMCQRDDEHIVVRGDITGETPGDMLFEAPVKHVIGKISVIEAASDIAEFLATQYKIVADAIVDRRRLAE